VRIALVLFGVALLAVLIVLAPGGPKEHEAGAATGSFLRDVTIVSREDGQSRWRLSSAGVRLAQDGAAARMRGVLLTFPERGMKVAAREGVYDFDAGNLALSGEVRAETGDFVVTAPAVRVDSRTGTVRTDQDVLLTARSFRVTGRGMEARENTVKVLHDVRAEFF
jgi:LPS export ABC transporter protein LptC